MHPGGFTVPDLSRNRRWALTPPFHPYHAEFLRRAVSFLLHFPYSFPKISLKERIPGITRSRVSWCPDFPHLLVSQNSAIIRQNV
ncbi:hypothetical protein LSS_01287 [Leptospira santarosai serovar Shermani str. LT 821]|uniref:Uncharacterized protein n=1 Tax=Leptospira santarosai serovar Shermani str. LT 821 TaxID=758847 RepID=K8YDJ9_9LEPT|nr:hypothetical protein LSS_01287 [Leptospira santarosai serovar Shermani str. LT 821]